MKKLLILLMVSILSLPALFAQDEGFDMETILGMLEGGDALVTADITEIAIALQDDTIEEGETLSNGELLQAEIDTVLIELADQGVSDTIIGQTSDVVDILADETQTDVSEGADPVTLGEALVIADPTTDDPLVALGNMEEAIVETVAVMATETLLSEGTMKEDLTDGLVILDGFFTALSAIGQATAQTSMASSLYGHQNYKLFAASIGFTGSLATNMDTIDSIIEFTDSEDSEAALEEMLSSQGFSAGFSVQSLSIDFGMNFSWLVDNLYLGVKMGSTTVDIDSVDGLNINLLGSPVLTLSSEDLGFGDLADLELNASMSTSVYGITANYRLIGQKAIPILMRWNGLSLGTGFIYNGFSIGATANLGTILADMAGEELTTVPDYIATFGSDSTSFTIPLEISTGLRLLSSVNLNLGVGADLKFGKSNVYFNLDSGASDGDDLTIQILNSVINQIFEENDMSFPYDNDYALDLVNIKGMIGLGIGLGPVSLNFDVTAYTDADMYNLGLVFGTNFVVRI